MKSPYNDTVMDHFMNPRNMGDLEDANAVAEVGNPACGDMMRLMLKINDDGVIEDIKFKTFGCAAAIASSSMTSEIIKGKTIEEAIQVGNNDIVSALGGVPEVKVHCSIMAEEALEDALKDYYTKTGKNLDDLNAMIHKYKGDRPEHH